MNVSFPPSPSSSLSKSLWRVNLCKEGGYTIDVNAASYKTLFFHYALLEEKKEQVPGCMYSFGNPFSVEEDSDGVDKTRCTARTCTGLVTLQPQYILWFRIL